MYFLLVQRSFESKYDPLIFLYNLLTPQDVNIIPCKQTKIKSLKKALNVKAITFKFS